MRAAPGEVREDGEPERERAAPVREEAARGEPVREEDRDEAALRARGEEPVREEAAREAGREEPLREAGALREGGDAERDAPLRDGARRAEEEARPADADLGPVREPDLLAVV